MKSSRTKRSLTRGIVLVAGFLLASAPSVFAATHAITPEKEVKDAKPIWQWLAFLVMIGVCIMVAFKNPKRSHQN